MNNIPRRQFLKASAAALVLGSSVSLTGQETTKPKLRKAIMYATVGFPGSVLEKFKALKESGFEGVEPMSHMNQEEVLNAAKETGLELPSVCCSTHWAKPLSDPNPATRETGLEGLKQALKDAKKYGSKSVLLVPAV